MTRYGHDPDEVSEAEAPAAEATPDRSATRYAHDPAEVGDASPILARIDAIAGKVEELVGEIVSFREELEARGAVLPHWQSYRLATVLARVDHAAAEIVIQQAARFEAEGQLIAWEGDATEPAR